MLEVVNPQSSIKVLDAPVVTSHPVPPASATGVAIEGKEIPSTLSELQQSWLSPEFTDALIDHMSRAKRKAILDQTE